MAFLTVAEFPAVRAAIDISLDASALPDEVVGLPTYAGEAERWVLAADPASVLYAPGTDQYDAAKAAAIFACAAMLAQAVPILTGETWGQAYRYTRKDVDLATLEAALWDRARTALARASGAAQVVSEGKAPSRFVFGLASAPNCRRW
jgi:hypothetical protein